jgi:hypothetical protein
LCIRTRKKTTNTDNARAYTHPLTQTQADAAVGDAIHSCNAGNGPDAAAGTSFFLSNALTVMSIFLSNAWTVAV